MSESIPFLDEDWELDADDDAFEAKLDAAFEADGDWRGPSIPR
jgi:hypothetical protein